MEDAAPACTIGGTPRVRRPAAPLHRPHELDPPAAAAIDPGWAAGARRVDLLLHDGYPVTSAQIVSDVAGLDDGDHGPAELELAAALLDRIDAYARGLAGTP